MLGAWTSSGIPPEVIADVYGYFDDEHLLTLLGAPVPTHLVFCNAIFCRRSYLVRWAARRAACGSTCGSACGSACSQVWQTVMYACLMNAVVLVVSMHALYRVPLLETHNQWRVLTALMRTSGLAAYYTLRHAFFCSTQCERRYRAWARCVCDEWRTRWTTGTRHDPGSGGMGRRKTVV
jgi:hypothetical protein